MDGTTPQDLENPGIDPGTSRMLSGRSTIWANSPTTEAFAIYRLFSSLHAWN